MKKYSLPEKIIEKSFFLSVALIKKLFYTEDLSRKLVELDTLEEGTLGKEVAKCLKSNKLTLVPYYESHDLKHTLLDYPMTPLGEIRLQAFMLGNGNWTIPSLIIFIYGALLLPNKWRVFASDFKNGRKAITIKSWTLEEYGKMNIHQLRNRIFNSSEVKSFHFQFPSLRRISQFGSFSVIIAGIFGMLFCFPYLWSSNMADLIGAGFPFVAGAILTIGGLMNLMILSRQVSIEH